MMRTRIFWVRNEVVEKKMCNQTSKRKESPRGGESGKVFQWKVDGQCPKRDPCSFTHDKIAFGNSGSGQRRKGRSSSPAPHSKAKTDGEKGNREENICQTKPDCVRNHLRMSPSSDLQIEDKLGLFFFFEPSLMTHHDTSTLKMTIDCRCTCSDSWTIVWTKTFKLKAESKKTHSQDKLQQSYFTTYLLIFTKLRNRHTNW